MVQRGYWETASLYAKYPFIVNLKAYMDAVYGIKDLEPIVERNPGLVGLAVERVKRSVESVEKGLFRAIRGSEEEEVLSFFLALQIIRDIGDTWLLGRYAYIEAERARNFLENDKPEIIERVGRSVGISTIHYHSTNPLREAIGFRGGVILYSVYEFSMSFPEYVVFARRMLGDASWRTVNQPVVRGRVFLDKRRAVRVVKEAIELWIKKLVDVLEPGRLEKLDIYTKAIEEIRSLIGEKRVRIASSGRATPTPTGVVEEAFPPCMANILARARRGEHLSHHERFAIATFMLAIGADIDEVVDVFRNMPDFNERITRYQVEHLAGQRGSMKKYRPYSCETMKTLGLCIAECKARTPLQVYYSNLRKMFSGKTRRTRERSRVKQTVGEE